MKSVPDVAGNLALKYKLDIKLMHFNHPSRRVGICFPSESSSYSTFVPLAGNVLNDLIYRDLKKNRIKI